MIAFIVLGLFVGYVFCALSKIYSVRHFLSFSFLAFIGALEGSFVANLINADLGFNSQIYSSLAIVGGALILASIKLLMFYAFKDNTRVSV